MAAQSIFWSSAIWVRPGQASVGSTRVALESRRSLDQHVLGQGHHDGPGTALHRDVKGPRQQFGYPGRVIDLDSPFGGRAEKGRVVHFLERAAPAHAPLDLANEQDQRHRIVLGDVNAMRGVGGPRPARDHGNARAAGQAAHGVGHHGRARFLAADCQVDRRVMQRIEHGQKAFARHAEHMLDALDLRAGRQGSGRRCGLQVDCQACSSALPHIFKDSLDSESRTPRPIEARRFRISASLRPE